jgi:hypothetical protein
MAKSRILDINICNSQENSEYKGAKNAPGDFVHPGMDYTFPLIYLMERSWQPPPNRKRYDHQLSVS